MKNNNELCHRRNGRVVLVIAWIGEGDVSFWNDVNVGLAEQGVNMCFMAYSRSANLRNIQFPFVDMSSFGASVHPSNFDAEGLNDSAHVEATWLMTKSMLDVSLVVLWNGLHGVWLAWNNLIKNEQFPHLIIEKGGFPATYQIDRNGINGLSDYSMRTLEELIDDRKVSKNSPAISDYLAEIQVSHNDTGIAHGGEQLRQKLKVSPDKKVVVYFGAWDVAAGISSTEFRHAQSPYFASSYNALSTLNNAMENFANVVVLYKLHPCDVSKIDRSKLRESGAIDASKYNAVDLIRISHAVCGLQSSLLYMACAMGKPVILLGKTILSSKKIAYEYSNEGESFTSIIGQALNLETWSEREANRAMFLDWYVCEYCFTADRRLLELGGRGGDVMAEIFCQTMRQEASTTINQIEVWLACAELWAKSKRDLAGAPEAARILDDLSRARSTPIGKALLALAPVLGFRALGRALSHGK